MRYLCVGLCLALGLAVGMSSALAQTVSVPWTELKALVEMQAKQAFEQSQEKPEADPFRYALHESNTKVQLGPKLSTAQISVSGTVISGKPEPIPLLPKGTVLRGKAQTQGGHLIKDSQSQGIAFLPTAEGEFEITFETVLTPERLDGQWYVQVRQIPALARTLTHTLAKDFQLSTVPKIKESVVQYRFESLLVAQARTTVRDIDMYHRIEWNQQRLKGRSLFVVKRDYSGDVTVNLPRGARLIQAEGGADQLVKLDEDSYKLHVNAEKDHYWQWDWVLAVDSSKAALALKLPSIPDNQGQVDWVNFHEPDGVSLKWPDDQIRIPIKQQRLFPVAKALFTQGVSFRVGHEQTLAFTWERFRLAKRPELIVKQLKAFMGIEDSGQVLTRFKFTVPAGHTGRWAMQPPAGAEIWQLRVNDQKRAVYSDDKGRWVVPLDKDSNVPCEVDLAYLIKGDPLVLQGRIDLALPALGLPAKTLSLEVGLPKRVNLVAMDSDLQPLSRTPACELGKHYQGHKHAFQQNYYRGQGEALAIYYREPVKESN